MRSCTGALDLRTGVIELVTEGLARPHGVFVDSDSVNHGRTSVLVGDSENHVVLRLTREPAVY
jgi:hypothetical protein